MDIEKDYVPVLGTRTIDITGEHFFELEVIGAAGSVSGHSKWLCLCHKCGQQCIRSRRFLISRSAKNPDCGCTFKAIQDKKRRDLSGEKFGKILVLYQVDNPYKDGKYGRSKMYMCRCLVCGGERILPAMEIKTNMQSCGCLRYQSEEMKRRSDLGVATNIQDGIHIPLLKRKEANKNSKTGVRGVYPCSDGTFVACVQIANRTRRKKGLRTIEDARKERETLKKEMLEEYGLDPSDFE